MRPSVNSWFFCILILLYNGFSFAQEATAPERPADLILKNGKIWTDPTTGRNWTSAISIRSGHILSLGTDKALEKETGPRTKIIDLKGKVVVPSFNDAHTRILEAGLSMMDLNLWGAQSKDSVQERLIFYAKANALKKWIFGRGWDSKLPKNKLTAKDLDAIEADRPVFIQSVDEDTVVLNTKALSDLKITKPDGVLTGSAAQTALFRIEPEWLKELSDEKILQALELAQNHLLKFGITNIQGRLLRSGFSRRYLDGLLKLYRDKKLNLRISLWGDLENLEGFREASSAIPSSIPKEWIQMYAVNTKLDGSLGSQEAALTEPYSEKSLDQQPEPKYSQKQLSAMILEANKQKIPVVIDAHGDRASTIAVGAMISVRRQLFNTRIRNRIDSLEVVPPYLYPALANNNITAGMELSHFTRLWGGHRTVLQQLGPKRLKHFFAWKSFIRAKSHYAFGSDWPSLPLNPFLSMQQAVTREQSAERITFEQALEGYTLGAAYATHEDHFKGSLREGKVADMIVLDQNPFLLRPAQLGKVQILMTIIDGKIVYDAAIPSMGGAPDHNTN